MRTGAWKLVLGTPFPRGSEGGSYGANIALPRILKIQQQEAQPLIGEPRTVIEWPPETLDSEEHSRDEHSLRAPGFPHLRRKGTTK